MSVVDEMMIKLAALPDKQREVIVRQTIEESKKFKWIPNAGPQTDAYFSKADCLLFGGEPGGGKSQLVLGLAFNCHKRTLIMRRNYGDLDRLVEDALKIHGSRDGFNGSPPPKLRINGEQIIDFAAANRIGDEQGQMGKGRDLLCVGKGTPVMMADQSYKPIESIKVGDMVMTLEGGKPVITVHPMRHAAAVKVKIDGVSQVQSCSHDLLTSAGWASYDKFCVSRHFCFSSHTSHYAFRRFPLLFEPIPKVNSTYFSHWQGLSGAFDEIDASKNGLCDERPRLWIHRENKPMGGQSYAQRLNDVAPQIPTDFVSDVRGGIPTHTFHKESYSHPYTKEIRQIDASALFLPFSMAPVGEVDLYDIEVQDANHYITLGGFVNMNCIDEATHFAESQIRFLMGWNRTEDSKQRVRTVLATNPPLTSEGLWVIKMFAPWLDPQYPRPARSGELRWVISDVDGKDEWVNGPDDARVINGKTIKPTSRSYIPSSVKDNPYYVASGYEQQLDAMPEPYRSLLMGGFRTSFKDLPNQIIPTKWVELAQERWGRHPPEGVPMCCIGVDASGGGDDPMIIAKRYDGWFDVLVEVPGKEIPMERAGAYCSGIVISHRKDQALVAVDMGGGYGGPMYEHLTGNGVEVKAYKGAEASMRRSVDGKLRFTNKRSAAYWYMREALDPGQPGGSPIYLPVDSSLMADLTAPTFDVTPNGIKAEPKEKVCDRLGRSTDRGDAVVMAWFEGPRETTNALEWIERKERSRGMPKMIGSTRTPITAQRRM